MIILVARLVISQQVNILCSTSIKAGVEELNYCEWIREIIDIFIDTNYGKMVSSKSECPGETCVTRRRILSRVMVR